MNLVKIFWDWFPYSLIPILIIPVIYWVFRPTDEETNIQNRAIVFLRGNTWFPFDATVNNDMIQFKIGETEYNEPILYSPRITYEKGKIYRDYIYAEGISGTIDIPPLTLEMRDKIFNILLEHNLIDKDKVDTQEKRDKFKDSELFELVKFYNFDIEQIIEKPMMKQFNSSINQFIHLGNAILRGIQLSEQSFSTWRIFLVLILGTLLGFFMGWSLTLKGVI